ncbi:MAG: M28 family peptidase [Acidobacteria bacterium]|nr:M28 family peptidase [Acidobacteriota bacterium]
MKRTMWVIAVPVLLLAAEAGDDGRRWWGHVLFLADDKLEGRNTGSPGHRKAAEYVAGEFERAGLKPAGTAGYFQPVKFRSRRIVEEQSGLWLVRDGKVEPVALSEEANISMRSDPPESLEADVVFVGYGLSIPEKNHEDLKGLDLRGKLVMYVSGGPSSIPGALRAHAQSAGERWKVLDQAGVVGALAVQNPRGQDIPWARATLARLQPAMSLADPALVDASGGKLSVTVNPAHADKFLAGSGHTIQELLDLANAGKVLPRFPVPIRVRAKVAVERGEVESQNVAGMLPGTDPKLKDEYVVLSAHLDHVGVGRPINGDSIYNGAMDNASGIASLLEISSRLRESQRKLRRSLLFVAVTGEEKGLLGSRYFAAHPTVKPQSIVADLNVDMFLPLFPLKILTAYGLEESDLGDLLRRVAEPLGIQVQGDQEPERNIFIRSDQYNFIRRGVPALAFKVGYEKGSPEEVIGEKWLRERYHAPSDDVQQPVDLQAAAGFNRVIGLLAEAVANRAERPKWNSTSFFQRYAGQL